MKLLAVALLFAPLVPVGAAAQTADGAAAAENMCDYCADYTDAAAAIGKIQSAYQPGAGYAAASADKGAAGKAARQDGSSHRILMFRVEQK
jgi:hypothetical protein